MTRSSVHVLDQGTVDARPGAEFDDRHTSTLDRAIERATETLLSQQSSDGHWLFELECDCTITAEYVLMMHFMNEVDEPLQSKMAVYLRRQQLAEGGWSLYPRGEMDVSCSVKAYYALKLVGNDPDAPHMRRARQAILNRGGAARANVFTRILLAQFGQVPWRAAPMVPVEMMLLPRWFPFHIYKVAYWSRTVMVPLSVLVSLRASAANPTGVGIAELFTVDPNEERDYFPIRSWRNRLYLYLERALRPLERVVPGPIRARAMERAHQWVLARLNGEDGLGAIAPAMVNAYEMLAVMGYSPEDPRRRTAAAALRKLVVVHEGEAYCQPCVSPVWDTALATHALIEAGAAPGTIDRSLAWLHERQIDQPGDYAAKRPVPGGGWAFQYRNDHYPDLDDTAVVAWAMLRWDPARFADSIDKACRWLACMQSANGGFAAFDADNTHWHLNEIPFADHGALLDPPTEDVSARVATLMGRLRQSGLGLRFTDRQRLQQYLADSQSATGAWWGRWGTNYIYGTWSVLLGLRALGVPEDDPAIQRAVAWLESVQHSDGGWGEHNDSYYAEAPDPAHHRGNQPSTSFHTAWAILALLAAGKADSAAVRKGVEHLIERQKIDGRWTDTDFTAPGFPKVFYLKYHGYSQYFPLWALARYRNVTAGEDRDVFA